MGNVTFLLDNSRFVHYLNTEMLSESLDNNLSGHLG